MEFNTLRNWIARGAISLSPCDQPAQGRGGRHILTMRTVYGIAVMKELSSYGLAPGQAGSAAHSFARLPQDPLFPSGGTILVVYKAP